METPADIAVSAAFVLVAGGFLLRRFLGPRTPPSCAPEANGRPQVVLGSRLARGLAGVQKGRERR
jgi:hypothetical protein